MTFGDCCVAGHSVRAAGRGSAPSCKAAQSQAAVFWETVQFLNLSVAPAFAGRVLVPGDSQVDGVSHVLRVPPGWLGLSWAGWNGQDCPLEGRQGGWPGPAGVRLVSELQRWQESGTDSPRSGRYLN